MNQRRIGHLIEKYISGRISPSDEHVLTQWYRKKSSRQIEWLSGSEAETEQTRKRIFEGILNHVERSSPAKKIWRRYYGAAAAILIGLASIYLVQDRIYNLPDKGVRNTHYHNDVPSGGKRATLTLSNGERILLEGASEGQLTNEGAVSISKTAKGRLSYQKTTSTSGEPKFNLINTPNGGEYRIELSDGTKVWLNAKSRLKFPVPFAADSRDVELEGEAYFEVAHNESSPFRVRVNHSLIEVLGTHFNVSGYKDDRSIMTTLVEGSVRIRDGAVETLLGPGQQAIIDNHSHKLHTVSVDTEQAVAWKNGYFLFVNEDLKDLMSALSRWYDIEVIYQGDVSRRSVFGTISRYKNISEVLHMLELTGVVKFKIEGRRVTVMP